MADAPRRQSVRFILLYALAAAGGAAAYVPFLTMLLPLRVTEMVGERDVATLGYIAFIGAIAASLAHIGFGWLSDRTGTRRGWIVVGLIGSGALLLAMEQARSPLALAALIVLWQAALNCMLAPLAAWGGDSVPDAQKGMLGGLLAISPAVGALSSALVTRPEFGTLSVQLAAVAGIVAALVLPVLLFGRPRPMPELMRDPPAPAPAAAAASRPRREVALMWLARLLVQIAEAALFAYILFWFRAIDPAFGPNRTATLFGSVLAASVPIALAAGVWSDRRGRPLAPLVAAATIGAAGLLGMAAANSLTSAIAAYAVFGLSTGAFLALHSAQTLRVLPRPSTRGRDLGFFNLTNTGPSLIMPWLAIGIVPAFGFSGLFLLLAVLAALAAALLAGLQRH